MVTVSSIGGIDPFGPEINSTAGRSASHDKTYQLQSFLDQYNPGQKQQQQKAAPFLLFISTQIG